MKIKTKKPLFCLCVIFSFFILFNSCKKDDFLPDETIDNIQAGKDPQLGQKDSIILKDTIAPSIEDTVISKEDSLIVSPGTDLEHDETQLPKEEVVPTQPIGHPTPVSVTKSSVSSTAYRIEESLPAGYVKDGSVDYTSYIQNAVNKYSELVFPGFPILVNDKGIRIPSNRKIYFLNGSELRLKPTSRGTYNILDIRNASNITLISPYIKGDKSNHLGTSGEYGMGIGIRGGRNITIQGAEIYDCWGDGIYVESYNGVLSQNVKLSSVTVKNARRAGISIISVDGLLIENSYFGYVSGAEPMAGINFEPNNPSSEFKNIKLNGIRTEYNGGVGIQIGISNLYGGSNKYLSFDFENFMDKGSPTGMRAAWSTSKRKGNETLNGTIKLRTAFWDSNTIRALKTNIDKDNLKMVISEPRVKLMSGENLSGHAAKAYLEQKGNINPIAKDNGLVIFK